MPEPRAGDQPLRPKTDAFLRWLGRYAFTIFFRKIEITGQDRVPETGPVIIVAKHSNSLVDGGFITTYLPRMPRILAASTVWDNKPLAPLLNAAGVIPLFRQQDQRAGTARNRHSFTASWDLLAAGGVLALFPEGISHNDPFIKPMKSGTARIALEAERHRGPLNIAIFPVGLIFEDKSKFRSRVLMQIGDPLEINDIVENYLQADQLERTRCVRQLTQRIHQGLIAVTPSFETWEEARLVGRAADIWGHQQHDVPTKIGFVEAVERRQVFARGYHWLRENHPDRIAKFLQIMTEYDLLLSTAGLRDQQVGATYPIFSALGFVARSFSVLAIRLPLSVIGTVLNLIPLQISALISRSNDPDKRAAWLIFSSVFVFPLIWLLQAVIAGTLNAHWFGAASGWITGVGVLLAGPIIGRHSLTFHDLHRRFAHEFRAWLLLRSRKNLAEKLINTRRDLIAELTDIVKFYVASVDHTDTPD